jgi:hypothetical protein
VGEIEALRWVECQVLEVPLPHRAEWSAREVEPAWQEWASPQAEIPRREAEDVPAPVVNLRVAADRASREWAVERQVKQESAGEEAFSPVLEELLGLPAREAR